MKQARNAFFGVLPRKERTMMEIIRLNQMRRNLSSFNHADPLNIEALLTTEERQAKEMAKKYCQQELLPNIVKSNRNEQFDKKIFTSMGELGLLGSTISSEYGCAGLSYVAYGLIAREVESVDSGYRSALSVQSSLVMNPIYQFGSEEQKKKYLPQLASGKMIGCFGLTEPNSGSDPASMETFAVRQGDCYVLNGTKTWITNSPIADIAIVWAKTLESEKDSKKNAKIRGFIVERNDIKSGTFSTPKIVGKLSLRASETGQLIMDNAKISEKQLLPNVIGMKGPFNCLNFARYGISWGVMGAAQTVFDIVRQYGLDRKQFNKPLAQNQLYQNKLSEMMSDIALGSMLAYRLGKMIDENPVSPPLEVISIAKRNNCRQALQIARIGRDMLGANGVSDEFHVMRISNNLEAVVTYEGTQDVHSLILGRAITGLSAF